MTENMEISAVWFSLPNKIIDSTEAPGGKITCPPF